MVLTAVVPAATGTSGGGNFDANNVAGSSGSSSSNGNNSGGLSGGAIGGIVAGAVVAAALIAALVVYIIMTKRRHAKANQAAVALGGTPPMSTPAVHGPVVGPTAAEEGVTGAGAAPEGAAGWTVKPTAVSDAEMGARPPGGGAAVHAETTEIPAMDPTLGRRGIGG